MTATGRADPRDHQRISHPWGERTPFGPGEEWPIRVDRHLAEGITESEVDRWVQTASILHSNGDALDLAVKDERIVGVHGRAEDRIDHGRLGVKDLFGWQADASPDRLTRGDRHRRQRADDDGLGPGLEAAAVHNGRGPHRGGVAMKFDLVLEELHRSEHDLGRLLLHASDRHASDHEVHHVARELATWSRRHLREIAEVGTEFGLDLDPEPALESGPVEALQQAVARRTGRRSAPALLLLTDLREIDVEAAGVSVDWELLAQAAQGVKRRDLLALTKRCHPDTLRQMRWANAMLKASSTQVLVS